MKIIVQKNNSYSGFIGTSISLVTGAVETKIMIMRETRDWDKTFIALLLFFHRDQSYDISEEERSVHHHHHPDVNAITRALKERVVPSLLKCAKAQILPSMVLQDALRALFLVECSTIVDELFYILTTYATNHRHWARTAC